MVSLKTFSLLYLEVDINFVAGCYGLDWEAITSVGQFLTVPTLHTDLEFPMYWSQLDLA
jgi:hypothetical protein